MGAVPREECPAVHGGQRAFGQSPRWGRDAVGGFLPAPARVWREKSDRETPGRSSPCGIEAEATPTCGRHAHRVQSEKPIRSIEDPHMPQEARPKGGADLHDTCP